MWNVKTETQIKGTDKNGHTEIWINTGLKPPKIKQLHRIVYECHYGLIEGNFHIDHICSKRPLDNRISNLQKLSPSDHMRKTRAQNPQGSAKGAKKREKPIFRVKKDGGKEVERIEFRSLTEASTA